jgi:hypothetical protein
MTSEVEDSTTGNAPDRSHSWRDLFSWSDSEFHGYVTDIDAVDAVITEFSRLTHTSYVCRKATKDFGRFNPYGKIT